MDSERDDETPEPDEPPAVFETSGADYDFLKAIADKRGYRLQRWGVYPVWWLEWREGYSNPVAILGGRPNSAGERPTGAPLLQLGPVSDRHGDCLTGCPNADNQPERDPTVSGLGSHPRLT